MGDDVPYTHPNGLIEIPCQWMLEDWEQFAFNADPAWGFIPENCEKVFVGGQIATYFQQNPDARHEIDFDRAEVAGNNVRLSLSSHERWSA
jgi:hypothetical protein